jgi:uncharacterized membrane protein
MTSSELASRPGDRFVAFACYGLLIAAPFTIGLLGLVAVAIAYLWRGRTEPLERSHFDRMIARFWMDLILAGLGLVCLWGALAAGFGVLIAALFGQQPSAATDHIGIGAIVLALLWLGLWVLGIGGLWLGSIFGAMRLASGRPAGKTRAR